MKKILITFAIVSAFIVFSNHAKATTGDVYTVTTTMTGGDPASLDGTVTMTNDETDCIFEWSGGSMNGTFGWNPQLYQHYLELPSGIHYVNYSGIVTVHSFVPYSPPPPPWWQVEEGSITALILRIIQWTSALVGILALISATKFGFNLIKRLFPNSY